MDWNLLQDQLQADGSLRDIYVRNADEQLWDRFLAALPGSPFSWRLKHGDRMLPVIFARFADAAALQETDPVLLMVDLSPALTLCCHFFAVQEIELDVAPVDLHDRDALNKLVTFMQWLARVVSRPVLLTHENQPEAVILQIEPRES